jgi:thiol-disulfide isomerase/thioredoxin
LVAVVSGPASIAQQPLKRFVVHSVPQPLPTITFWNGNGTALRIADFRGRVILLNIWATWCVPCRVEMPTLDRLLAAMGGPDFEVVALSIDRAGSKVVQEFYAKIDIKYLSLYIDMFGKASGDLQAVGLPTTLLIDREGREIGRLVGPAEWDTPEMQAFLRRYVSKKHGGRSLQPALNRAGKPTSPSTSAMSEHDFNPSKIFAHAAPGTTTSKPLGEGETP